LNFNDVENQLTDLPTSFQRFGFIFAGLITSLTAMLARNTQALDQLSAMTDINTAKWGWLSAIGSLYDLPRTQYETDPQYRTRLLGTLSANTGTPQAIVNFIKLALNLSTTITENFNVVDYQINFANPPSQQTLQQVAITINRVRPAGVPFLPLYQINGGLYLNTCNYFNTRFVTGSYFSQPHSSIAVTLAQNTNNPTPILPTNYLTDVYVTGIAQVSFPL